MARMAAMTSSSEGNFVAGMTDMRATESFDSRVTRYCLVTLPDESFGLGNADVESPCGLESATFTSDIEGPAGERWQTPILKSTQAEH